MAYQSCDIKNLAFVGHGGSGKTTLSEVLLKKAGLISRVPAGVMDHSADEKKRKHSIDASIAHFPWAEHEINVIDAPGYQDFFYQAISALEVAETAVIVISATDGVTVNTRKVWNIAEKKGLAKFIVLTKIDGENVSFEDTIKQIEEYFGSSCIPFIIPDGVGENFSKVSKILDDEDSEYKEQLLEATVETDDELLNLYLEGEEIPKNRLQEQFKKAIMQGAITPIISMSTVKEIGIDEFLEMIINYAPSPADTVKKAKKGEEEIELKTIETEEFVGQVFKIFNDPFGRISYFKVYSGTLKSNASIFDVNLGKNKKIGGLFKVVGKEQKPVDQGVAGDLVAVAKIEDIQIGDTLTSEKSTLLLDIPNYPTPMVNLAVIPKSRVDEQKIGASLAKLAEEDRSFLAKRDPDTNELVIMGMSTLHLEIILNRLKNRFKVDCDQKLPKIAYKETISKKIETSHRHKKQSGGHGQFGEVHIRMAPVERGKGFEFVDKIVGGVIPAQFVGSTEKGIRATLGKGILADYPIVDVRVELFFGKTHDVDSSDAAFQIAGSKAFQKGFMEAGPVLLEPVENIEITVPSKYMGDIIGDLNSKRGRIMGSDTNGDDQIIKAQVPMSEILTYSTELNAITGGEGSYTLSFSHYDIIPSNIQEKIVARAKKEKEESNK